MDALSFTNHWILVSSFFQEKVAVVIIPRPHLFGLAVFFAFFRLLFIELFFIFFFSQYTIVYHYIT